MLHNYDPRVISFIIKTGGEKIYCQIQNLTCSSSHIFRSLCCCNLDILVCRTVPDWSRGAPGWYRCHWGWRGWRGRRGRALWRPCTPRSSCSHNTQLEIRWTYHWPWQVGKLHMHTYDIILVNVNYSPMLWVPKSILDAAKLHKALFCLQRHLNELYHCLVHSTAN